MEKKQNKTKHLKEESETMLPKVEDKATDYF